MQDLGDLSQKTILNSGLPNHEVNFPASLGIDHIGTPLHIVMTDSTEQPIVLQKTFCNRDNDWTDERPNDRYTKF